MTILDASGLFNKLERTPQTSLSQPPHHSRQDLATSSSLKPPANSNNNNARSRRTTKKKMAPTSPRSGNYELLESGSMGSPGSSRQGAKRFAWKKFAMGAGLLIALVYLFGPRKTPTLPGWHKTPTKPSEFDRVLSFIWALIYFAMQTLIHMTIQPILNPYQGLLNHQHGQHQVAVVVAK